jgi:hypothetical protein
MPHPGVARRFPTLQARLRADGVRFWGQIAQGPGSGGRIEQATVESEQRT